MLFLFSSSFITAQVFPMLTHWFGTHFNSPAGVYWIFAAICAACAVFSWKMVPETKGLSLERISEFWQNKNISETAWSRRLHFNNATVSRNNRDLKDGCCIRCLEPINN